MWDGTTECNIASMFGIVVGRPSIVVKEGFFPSGVRNESLLLHELTHYLQFLEAGKVNTFCGLEVEAYEFEMEYLIQVGKMEINKQEVLKKVMQFYDGCGGNDDPKAQSPDG